MAVKHVSTETKKYATTKELMESVIYVSSMPRICKENLVDFLRQSRI
jgi:hypothetical protein